MERYYQWRQETNARRNFSSIRSMCVVDALLFFALVATEQAQKTPLAPEEIQGRLFVMFALPFRTFMLWEPRRWRWHSYSMIVLHLCFATGTAYLDLPSSAPMLWRWSVQPNATTSDPAWRTSAPGTFPNLQRFMMLPIYHATVVTLCSLRLQSHLAAVCGVSMYFAWKTWTAYSLEHDPFTVLAWTMATIYSAAYSCIILSTEGQWRLQYRESVAKERVVRSVVARRLILFTHCHWC